MRLAMSIMIGLQVIAGAANLADLVGSEVSAWVVLIVAGTQAGMHFWTRGEVGPVVNIDPVSTAPQSHSDRPQGQA